MTNWQTPSPWTHPFFQSCWMSWYINATRIIFKIVSANTQQTGSSSWVVLVCKHIQCEARPEMHDTKSKESASQFKVEKISFSLSFKKKKLLICLYCISISAKVADMEQQSALLIKPRNQTSAILPAISVSTCCYCTLPRLRSGPLTKQAPADAIWNCTL